MADAHGNNSNEEGKPLDLLQWLLNAADGAFNGIFRGAGDTVKAAGVGLSNAVDYLAANNSASSATGGSASDRDTSRPAMLAGSEGVGIAPHKGVTLLQGENNLVFPEEVKSEIASAVAPLNSLRGNIKLEIDEVSNGANVAPSASPIAQNDAPRQEQTNESGFDPKYFQKKSEGLAPV